MFNVAIKPLGALIALVALFSLASCGPDKEELAASQLLGEADRLLIVKDYQGAIDSIKVLNQRYPRFGDIRRAGLRIQANAMEGLVIDSIERVEPVLAQATIEVDSLKKEFVYLAPMAAGMDGYYIPSALVKTSVMQTAGLQPRVSEDGYFYLVCNIEGKKIGFRTLKITAGDSTWESRPVSEKRVLAVESSEVASFAPEDVEGLGQWLESHPAKSYKATFTGSKGSLPFTINGLMAESIILSDHYSLALQTQRSASIQREKLERKLQTIRDNLANLPLPSQD